MGDFKGLYIKSKQWVAKRLKPLVFSQLWLSIPLLETIKIYLLQQQAEVIQRSLS